MPRSSLIVSNTRSYITALGSSSVLVGAIALACAALAGVVGYQGMPGDSNPAGSSSVTVEASRPDAVFTAAPPTASAKDPAERAGDGAAAGRPDSSAPGRGKAAGEPAGGRGSDEGTSRGDGGGEPSQPPAGGGGPSGGEDPPAQQPPTAPPAPPGNPAPPALPLNPAAPVSGGAFGSAVKGAEQVVGAATGAEIPVGRLTNPVTAPVDGLVGALGSGPGARHP